MSYGFSQEEAKALGAPVCPECRKYADALSEHCFFEWDVVAARCTPCRRWTILGSTKWLKMPSQRWYKVPLVGRFIVFILSWRFTKRWTAMARRQHEYEKREAK